MWPSPLKSAAAICPNKDPGNKVLKGIVWNTENTPDPLLRRMETSLDPISTTAKSMRPSLLKSADVMLEGDVPPVLYSTEG
ncbi:hypothetical protein YSY22_57540 [Brevibacillus formosus]